MGQHPARRGRPDVVLSQDDGEGHHEDHHGDRSDHDQPGGGFFRMIFNLRGLAGLYFNVRLPVAGARLADIPASVEDRDHRSRYFRAEAR